MAGILDTVDQRTQLVGENRLELLMFRLKGRQLFALNVFKVQEVVQLPKLTLIPHSHPGICGVSHMRNSTIPVIDLSQAIGLAPMGVDPSRNLIVTEYNRTIQGFMVGSVDRIINLNWDSIMPPPKSAGRSHYLTAITRLENNELVEIIDVEKVLAEIISYNVDVTEGVIDETIKAHTIGKKIIHADDSSTARLQTRDALAQIGIEIIPASDGAQALKILKDMADSGKNVYDEVLMLITDAEMPVMDGYRLTHEIRKDPRMKDLYIALNTSLSGGFNEAMVKKVGCDKCISKFQPDVLITAVQDHMREVLSQQG